MQHGPLSDSISRLKITYIEVLDDLALLNTILFLFNQTAQQSAAAPSKIWLLSLDLIHVAKNQID
jgi:hypothetical protein